MPILRTAVAPTWNEIGQLGAIVVLRTALNYFLQLEIDKAEIRAPRAGRLSMEFLGITWVGVTAENGRKVLASLVLLSAILVASSLIRFAVGLVLSRTDHATVQTMFWTRQAVSLAAAVGLLFGLLSIWFSEPARLATAFGLMSAGLAFALQQVITAVAGYFVVLRGSTFRVVGNRISMGGASGRRYPDRFHPDHDHGDGSTAQRTDSRPSNLGKKSPVHWPRRHRQQLEDLQ